MIEEVFSIGDFGISPFGVMLVAAFVAAYFQLRWGLVERSIGDDEDASAILFAAGVGGIVGAKLYYVLLNPDEKVFSRAGLVWYGGFLLAVPAVLWILRRRRLPFWPTLDAATLGLALGYGIGRIGCFLVGDDYGVPTDLPWGVIFPVGRPEPTAGMFRSMGVEVPADVPADTLLAVHPTQLYETALALGIWLVGLAYFRRRPPAGQTALLVLALLALERFAIEFLRAKDDRFFGDFTLAQVLSAAIVVVVVSLFLARRRRLAAAAAG